MELDIRLLRTFRVVAQTRSFTGAARRLKLTQSAISQQVSALERELKTQLLVRSNKFVGLTTMGEILLQCACQVLDSLDRVRDLLAEHSSPNSGRLSVAVPATFCHWLLPHLIDEFHQRFPAIQVCVVMTDVEAAVERLAHRELDVALIPTTMHHKSLGMAPLGRDELVAVIAPGNPLAKRERVLPADLKEQRLITPPPGNLRFVPWDNFLIQSGVFPKVVVETDDLELAKHLARQDVGITVAPRWSVLSAVERGECVALPIGPAGVYREWYLGYHNGTQLSGARRNFLRVCAEQLPRLFSDGGRKRPAASAADATANGTASANDAIAAQERTAALRKSFQP
jgi:DNA-binding transcriptional LysR family regulator